jgi:hypothetical protein
MVNTKTIEKLLKASYDPKDNIGNKKLDKQLSGKRVSVYYNPKTKKSFVVHRGTASATDWIKTNIPAFFGYEKGARFKHAANIQRKAENKYGKENVTTLGHSLGGRIAEKVGKNSNQVITYNKYTTPFSATQIERKNQIDIRVKNDVASYLSQYQRKRGVQVTLPTTTLNPIKAHNINQLK